MGESYEIFIKRKIIMGKTSIEYYFIWKYFLVTVTKVKSKYCKIINLCMYVYNNSQCSMCVLDYNSQPIHTAPWGLWGIIALYCPSMKKISIWKFRRLIWKYGRKKVHPTNGNFILFLLMQFFNWFQSTKLCLSDHSDKHKIWVLVLEVTRWKERECDK